jgi:predicted SAM-dependent methyltransferase
MNDSQKKLEIGCGQSPTPGYIHNDINMFDGVDIVGNPWELRLDSKSLDEVIALGVIEHLAYKDAKATFVNIRRMLRQDGVFLFDVPDIPVWCGYVADHFAGKEIPCTIEHALATLYGWQRWAGDEHKSGWHKELLEAEIRSAGFSNIRYGTSPFLERGLARNRMARDWDAHLYCEVS